MRRFALLISAAAGLSLSACMGSGGGAINRSLESPHQPVVTQHTFVFDANAASGELSPSELNRVSGWLDAMNVRYGDRVSIDESATYGARAARDSVAELLTRKGLMLADHAPITGGAIAPGHIRIVLTRARAEVHGCPDWDTRSATDYHSRTTSNYGCATNANLAAMVADPMDLVRGQADRSNDPLAASRAIDAYRNARPTGPGINGGAGGTQDAAPALPGMPTNGGGQ